MPLKKKINIKTDLKKKFIILIGNINQQIDLIINLLDIEAVKNSNFNKKFLFYYVSWFLFILYFSFSFLAKKNPFGILIPFNLYSYTGMDEREKTTVYVSDGQQNIFKVSRKIYLEEKNPREKVETLIAEIGTPPFYEKLDKGNENEFHAELLRLPEIRSAVISIWFLKDKLMIDLDEKELQDIFSKIKVRKAMARWNAVEGQDVIENKKNVKEQESLMRTKIIASTFMATEQTLFDNFKDIQTIEFRLNGYSRNLTGFAFNLSESIHRNIK